MANKIYVDTQLLEDLGEQIRQLQRSLDSVNGEITRSLSEVRRVASSQDQLIRKMQTVGQNTRKTSDHAGKLANAVIYAAKLWEEAEKKISQRAITDGSAIAEGEVVAAGGLSPTQKPDWFSSILDWFKRNYDSFTNRNDAQLQISLMGQMLYHLIRQEPFSSGSINEFKFQPLEMSSAAERNGPHGIMTLSA